MTTVLESLQAGLRFALEQDGRVYLLGEDLLDPYGGAFKVTRGLSTAFPGRVLTTPISEAGITGVAAGMALRGFRPVVEIMFGDFVTLIADQVINSAAKFRWMYHDGARVPLVIRTPMGGRRGYGPTHSQTLEKLFLGAPGLGVLAPCALRDPGAVFPQDGSPGGLLAQAILQGEDPTLFVENKLLYLQTVEDAPQDFDLRLSGQGYTPTYTLSLQGAPPARLTLAAYGYMASLAVEAARALAYEAEIFAEIVIPTRLAPFQLEPVIGSAGRTGRLLAIEEGTLSLGWGAEVLAQAAEKLGGRLRAARRLAARDLPIPASGPLEAAALPSAEDVFRAARQMF